MPNNLDQILDDYREAVLEQSFGRKEAKAQIAEAIQNIIGDGEVHVSHVCPQDSIPCREFQARGALRNEQRAKLREFLESSNDPRGEDNNYE